MQFYMSAMQNYFNVSGRATRRDYWMFLLFNMMFAVAFGFVCGMLKMPMLAALYSVATLIPSITIQIRRAHDTNHRGWWLLVPVYGFCLLVFKGETVENRWGKPPGAPTPSPEVHQPVQKVG